MNRSVDSSPGFFARTEDGEISRPFVISALAVAMVVPLVSAYFLQSQSLRLDEAQSLWQTSRSATEIFKIIAGDVHVPLYHLILHFWRIVFGDGVAVARLLSLAFFLLSIPALYLLGERVYGRRVGLFAAVLFAISPFMNWYGMEIRMYTLFAFLTILNQYFFVRLFNDERPNDSVWGLYALTGLLGVFSHYFFFLNFAGQALFYILRRRFFPRNALWRFILIGLLVAAAFAPWVWYVRSEGTIGFQTPALVVPTSVNLFNAFSQFLFGFQTDALNTMVLSLWPLLAILAVLSLGRIERPKPETEYFVITILTSFALAFAVSTFVVPVFVSRYLIFTLPAFYLLVGGALSVYAPRMRLVMAASLSAVMIATLAVEILNPLAPVKEDYRAAVTYLSTHATAQDTIVLSAPFTLYPIQYYYRGAAPLSTLPMWNQYAHGPIPPYNKGDLPSQVAAVTKNYQRAYLLLSYDQGYEKDVHDFFESHYAELEKQTFSDGLTLYVYRLRYDTNKSSISLAR